VSHGDSLSTVSHPNLVRRIHVVRDVYDQGSLNRRNIAALVHHQLPKPFCLGKELVSKPMGIPELETILQGAAAVLPADILVQALNFSLCTIFGNLMWPAGTDMRTYTS
jgi:hypothetical protein